MESASQLLYPRYTSLSDAILYPEGSVLPGSPSQTTAGPVLVSRQAPSPSVQSPAAVLLNAQPLFRTALQPSQVDTAAPEEATKPKKPKKKKQKVKEDPAAKVSGPSNAEEAQLMRSVLGFAPASPAATPSTLTPHSTAVTQQPQAPPQLQPAASQAAVARPQLQPAATTHAAAHQPVAQPQQQQHQPAPIQPQQQSTFTFGFAADKPAGADASAQTAAAPAQAASPATAQQPLPSPPSGAEPATEFVARRVFVGGMPFTYEVDAIREYWSFCGEIEDLDVMRFPDTGRFKGIAFITYATEEGYEEALKCDGTDLDGQQLRVQKCMSAGQHGAKKKQAPAAAEATTSVQQQPQPAAPKVAGYHVAYVGNLAFEAGDAEVQQLFPDCNVTKVRLHTDKVTGKSRGFAHVHFLDEASLDKAMQFNGADLHGRQVKVSYAQRKK